MGLLSDPSLTPSNKIGRYLSKHSGKLSLLFILAGLIWFVCLSHPNFNHNTYLSENALSPGLVYPEMKQDSARLVQTYIDELTRERESRRTTTPFSWIVSKMTQIGLETHIHNFTVNMSGKLYNGKNVYGILRAPRIGSTEGIVFSAPYRAPASVHEEISASVPVLLAFAEFARRKNYWAKDLIFLVTEQEQLGMHAWLEAYFEGGIVDSIILNSGSLPARAGALQAALNLEVQGADIDYVDVKIEGLNGQLPNLDMFNLVQRIFAREGISSGYKHTAQKKRRYPKKNIENNLKHMCRMLLTQSTGIPNGNHGLFHRYRVEALTLEAVKRTTHDSNRQQSNAALLSLLKSIEGISRSLNNLLERFHQSYFFYILVANDRFVSIGDFIPCLILLIVPMFLKAFLLWLTANGVRIDSEMEENNEEEIENEKLLNELKNMEDTVEKQLSSQRPYAAVIVYAAFIFGLGFIAFMLPMNQNLIIFAKEMGLPIGSTILAIITVITTISFVVPPFISLPDGSLELLHIGTLLFLAVSLIVVGLLNFAIGFILAVIIAPLSTLIDTKIADTKCKLFQKTISKLYLILCNPLIAFHLLVLILTIFEFPEFTIKELLKRSLKATEDAMVFAIMDYSIYGNWLYAAITSVFLPLWTMCWTLTVSRRNIKTLNQTVDKKTN